MPTTNDMTKYIVFNCSFCVSLPTMYETREQAQSQIDILELRWMLQESEDEMPVYEIRECTSLTPERIVP